MSGLRNRPSRCKGGSRYGLSDTTRLRQTPCTTVYTFHKISAKHLDRYGAEFAGGHTIRLLDTLGMVLSVVVGMVGKRLPYKVVAG